MSSTQSPFYKKYTLDTLGGSLSFACALHCLALPVLLIFWPSLKWMTSEWVHQLLLLCLVPVAAYALISGYRKHHQGVVLLLGGAGLVNLVVAVLWGHALHLETPLTVVGSLALVAAHVINIRQCQCSTCQDGTTPAN